MVRRTAAHATRSRLVGKIALALAAVAAAAGTLLAPGERPARAAGQLTINVPIAIDGGFSDWDAVLANPLQTTRDGDGSSAAIKANCALYSTDRDCPQTGGTGNDFLTFAWTYDATNVYLYVERYGSTANGVDFLFVADVDRDRRLRLVDAGGGASKDTIVHANWFGGTGTVDLRLWRYDPADDINGDPLVCSPVAPATACANAAGVLAAPEGYVDGYKLPGTNPPATRRACAGCTGRGGADGLRVEIAVPWTAFGTTLQAPFYWHTVSSNNDALASAVDNIGAPDGGLGSFVQRGVSLAPDGSGAILSPGQKTYVHALRNEGNDQDWFNLVATSSQGAQVEVLESGVVIGTDATGDGTWDAILGGHDVDGDGKPDVTLGAGLSRDLSVRITMPEGRSGQDVTRLTATSGNAPTVSATATDTSHVGTAAFVPVSHAAYTVAGQPVPFRASLVNGQGGPDTFELDADAGCAGFRVELAQDASGDPGAIFAVDADGDGTWDSATPDADLDGLPELGPVGAGTSSTFHLLVTPPGDAVPGASCTVALTATGSTGATARATHAVTVASAVTFAPDYRGAADGLADAADTQIPSGGAVFFPAAIRNAEATARAYALTQTQTGGAGATARVWSDPDGDGNPSDGAVITQTNVLPAFGGTQHVVVEVRAGTAPTGSFLVTTTTATALAGGASDAQIAEAVVGFLAVFADALHSDASNSFAPCAAVHVEARGLLPGDVGRYALEWAPPSGAAPPGVSPWPTTARGTAEAVLDLPQDAALGTWTARLLELGALKDDVAFTVALPGATAASVSTDGARYLPGDAVAVSASVWNDSGAPLEGTSLVYSGPAARTRASVNAAPGVTIPDAFTFTLAPDAAPGPRTLTLGWQLACASAPFRTATATFDVAPLPPAVAAPAADALVADATPTISGTALPGASVAVTIDPAGAALTSPPVAADGAGAWSWTVPDGSALAEGEHFVTARQTSGGVESDASGAVRFVVDTVPPAAPAIASPASGTTTRVAEVAVSGTALDPEARSVELLVDGAAVATVPVVAGAFSYPATLADGTHALAARALDAAGNASAPSSAVSITVDTIPPARPTLALAIPSPTNADPVPFTGTAEPLADVELLRAGVVVATVQAGADGAFSAPATLAEGSHALVARATDLAGNVGPESDPAAVLVDRSAPALPAVTAPADGAVLGAADLVAGQVVFSGTSEPLALVEIELDGVAAGGALADALGAWSVPATVAAGPHTVRARATDPAGNASGLGAAVAFTVDVTVPATPVLTAPTGPLATSALDLLVAGTSEPGATIRIFLDGVLVDEVTADALGAFSSDVALPAADGTTQLAVVAVDAAGNPSAPTAAIPVVVDRSAPIAPAIAAPAPGASVGTSAVVVSGTAEPFSTVRVGADTGETAEVTAAADGTWLATLVALGDGAHAVTVRSTDAAGNFAESTRGFTVDTLAPATPVVDTPASGAFLASGSVVVSGTAEPLSTVLVTADSGETATVAAAADGAYQATLALADGARSVTVRSTDAAGNFAEAARSFTVDTAAPTVPQIDAPASGAFLASGSVVVSGTAEPLSTILVTADSGQTATVAAAADGTYQAALALPDGGRTVTVRSTDAAGNLAEASRGFTVDTAAPAAPAIAAPADGTTTAAATIAVSGTAPADAVLVRVLDGGAVVATGAPAAGAFSIPLTPAAGGHVYTAVAVDAAGNASPPSAAVSVTVDRSAPLAPALAAPASPTNAAQVTFSGSAEPGSTVEIVVAGAVVGTGTADPTTGAYAVPVALAEGGHFAAARARDAAGNTGPPSAQIAVVVDRTGPVGPGLLSPFNGELVGASDLVGSNVVVSGRTEPLATVAVDVDGAVTQAAADANGDWSVPVALADGPHVVRLTATDAAGNASLEDTAGFTLDATAPAAPVLTAPAAGPTNAATVYVAGTAEPGSTVHLLVGGAEVGTAVADPTTGAFDATVALPGADGGAPVSAVAEDLAGNASSASSAVAVAVDRTAPAAPTIDAPADGAAFPPGEAEIRGHAEPGAEVAVTVAGETETVTAAGDGTWSVVVPVPAGAQTVSVTATDPAGNGSAAAAVDVTARTDDGAAGGGCGCRSTGGATGPLALLALLALAPRRRRLR